MIEFYTVSFYTNSCPNKADKFFFFSRHFLGTESAKPKEAPKEERFWLAKGVDGLVWFWDFWGNSPRFRDISGKNLGG